MTNVKNNKQISEILHKYSFDEVNKIRRKEGKPEQHADKHIVGNQKLGFYFLDPRFSYRSEISATMLIHNKDLLDGISELYRTTIINGFDKLKLSDPNKFLLGWVGVH